MDKKKPLRFSDVFSIMGCPEKEAERPLCHILSTNIDGNYDGCTGTDQQDMVKENMLHDDSFLKDDNPTSYGDFESYLLNEMNENFYPVSELSNDDENSFLINAYPTENKEGYSIESNAVSKDVNKHTDAPYDTAQGVDFVPCRNYYSNVNETFIVDTATTWCCKGSAK